MCEKFYQIRYEESCDEVGVVMGLCFTKEVAERHGVYVVLESFVTRGFFFFSSRRRHTRLQGDWSSDVCSSDLPIDILFHSDNEEPIMRGTCAACQVCYYSCPRIELPVAEIEHRIFGRERTADEDRKSVV